MISPRNARGGGLPAGRAEHGILHRAAAWLSLAAISAALIGVAPQARAQRKTSAGPRAISIVVMDAPPPFSDERGKRAAGVWIIPIALWYQNRYFDANLYGARPEPMALDGGVVYEARRAGEAQGLFTVAGVAQVGKQWVGSGTYRTMKELEERQRARAAHAPVPPTEKVQGEGPPKLRRGDAGSKPATPPAPAPTTTTPAPDATKTPPAAATPSPEPRASSTPSPAAPADDPDRPVLHRAPEPESAPAPAKPSATASADEDDRPRLKRTPEGAAQTIAPAIKAAPAATRGSASSKTSAPEAPGTANAKPITVLAAVSDAKGAEGRPYAFQWSADEQARLTRAAVQAANAAIAAYAAKQYGVSQSAAAAPAPRATAQRSRTRSTTPRPAPPAPSASSEPLDEQSVHAFDLQYDNYPEIVLTGRRTIDVPMPGGEKQARAVYIALALKVDLRAADPRDVVRPLLSYITDDAHLDENPRLTLIDAIDADGDAFGELLFRSTTSASEEHRPAEWGFQLYSVGPDRLRKVYDSEGKME